MGAGYAVTSAESFSPKLTEALDIKALAGAILDLDLGPGPNGLDVGSYLRTVAPELPLVVLTSYVDLRPFMAGRLGLSNVSFINKAQISNLGGFELTLRAALLGKASGQQKTHPQISETSMMVWTGVARGSTNEQIAKELKVGTKAIEKTISKLIAELEINPVEGNPRVKLVRRFYERNGQLPNDK